MFFDPMYMLLLLVTGGLSMFAQLKVKSAFSKWSKVGTRGGRTGAMVARQILEQSGIYDVQVEKVGGFLSDHYDPRTRTLRLSPQVYDSTSVAAVGVAAHEVGHAIQHARAYWPLQVRSFLAPAAAFGGNISMFVIMGGALLSMFGLIKIGIALFAVTVAFVLITLPVEFDASNRAKALLPQLGITQGEEGRGVASVLNAAALTYLAAAIAAVGQLLYFLMRFGLLGSRND
ncbi:MAG: zinc metallopeptidase [Deltaproteobacteria bacterium]|nr:zinc metallopeptidase [Deltaproteobacteria bacterium]